MTIVSITIEPTDGLANDPRFLDWLREVGVVPENTYRAVITADELTVNCYRLDDEGAKYFDHDLNTVAVEEPHTLSVTPPGWLFGDGFEAEVLNGG